MNSNTSKRIAAGAATVIAASLLTLSPHGADARVCPGAQDDAQCVVTPPASNSTPPHYCPVINGTPVCASDADLGLTGAGGTFVAGVYIPDLSTEVYIPDIVQEVVVPDLSTEIYIPDIVKEVSVDSHPTDWVDSIGDGCVRAPWPQIVACPG